MPGIYPPDASVDYDLAVRENADKVGMQAFGPGDYNLTMLHYGMKNTWEGRRLAGETGPPPPPAGAGKKKTSAPKASRAPLTGAENGCYAWNYEPSCPKASKCKFPHVCRSCGGDHKAPKCPNAKK